MTLNANHIYIRILPGSMVSIYQIFRNATMRNMVKQTQEQFHLESLLP